LRRHGRRPRLPTRGWRRDCARMHLQ
jgi:hypothetical protein